MNDSAIKILEQFVSDFEEHWNARGGIQYTGYLPSLDHAMSKAQERLKLARDAESKNPERDAEIREIARQNYAWNGDIEFDPNCLISEREKTDADFDNGAYVQGWVWVDFENTNLDKEVKS